MYFEFRPPWWIDRHQGPYWRFLERYEGCAKAAALRGKEGLEPFVERLLPRIGDERNLRCAWDHLAAHGGPAPGNNGWTYRDFRDDEVWSLLRALRDALDEGIYRPGKDRIRHRSKGPGRGDRALAISNIEDRVVARGIVQIVQPLLDPTFDPNSFGGRPKRSHLHALGEARVILSCSSRLVWITDDIRDAFDNVPLGRLLEVLRMRLPNEDFMKLMHVVLANKHNRGLRQGSPLSPLLLNVYLDHFLDRKWRKLHPDVPLLRYVDDLLVMCSHPQEAEALYGDLGQLVQAAGLRLKGSREASIKYLASGMRADWLGFQVGWHGGGLAFHLAPASHPKCWVHRLHDGFERAQERPESPRLAAAVVRGLVEAAAPAFHVADRPVFYAEVKRVAGEYGFEELPSSASMTEFWRNSFRRWDAWVQSRVAEAVRPSTVPEDQDP